MAPIPYPNYQEGQGYVQQENVPLEPESMDATPLSSRQGGPSQTELSHSAVTDQSYSAMPAKSLGNDSGLSETVLESPQLLKLNKSSNLPFSPSQVNVIYV